MPWIVLEHPDFVEERADLEPEVLDHLAAVILALQEFGPSLGRPSVDTLNGSNHGNMKEIRFSTSQKQVWRFAFAFDENRNAVIFCGADKQGVDQKRFYKTLIKKADSRFDDWLTADEE